MKAWRALCGGLAVLLCGAAQAATYSLPAAIGSGPFASCSFYYATTYQCGPHDIDFGNDNNVVLNITSDMELVTDNSLIAKNNFTINAAPGKLSITTGGSFEVGNNFSGTANILSGGNVTFGNNVSGNGNITAGGNITIPSGHWTGTCSPSVPNCGTASAPSVLTVAASSISASSATLNGTVSSNGAATTVSFNYGLTTGYGSTAAAAQSPLASSASGASVSLTLTGLSCGTTYNFRVTATNSAGSSNGGNLSFTTAACGAAFDAYETSYTAAQAIAGTARIKTHVASGSGLCISGGACNLQIGAFNTGKTALQTGFTGPVKVEIVNAASGNCAGYALVATVSASLALNNSGETTVTLPAVANSYANARIRISYPASGAATSQSCSSDNFAIRPSGFASVSARNATWTTAGSSNTLNAVALAATPLHKAGRPFSLNATAVNASGATTTNYSATPTATLSQCAGTACPTTQGTLTVGSGFVSGVMASTTASYNDLGAFSLVLSDTSFAAVDASDSSAAERGIVSSALSVGRFVPDHFDTAVAAQGCVGFTYSGQPLNLSATAKDASGNTLTRYVSGALANALTLSEVNGVAGSFAATSIAATSFAAGVSSSSATYSFTSRSTVPTAIRLRVQDSDGVNSATGNDGTATTSAEGVSSIVSGRIALAHAYGTEQLALPLPTQLQQYAASGWRAATDSCTQLTAAHFAFGQATACGTAVSSCISALSLSATGAGPNYSTPWTVTLGKPTATGAACVTLNLDGAATGRQCTATGTPGAVASSAALPWLRFPWSSASPSNPSARVNFGAYRSPLIYRRENY